MVSCWKKRLGPVLVVALFVRLGRETLRQKERERPAERSHRYPLPPAGFGHVDEWTLASVTCAFGRFERACQMRGER